MRPTARTETRTSPLWADLTAMALLSALALVIAVF